jgi:hypothetical protein
MDTINLKEILDGELIDEPGNLSGPEKHDFAMALTNALVARYQETLSNRVIEYPDSEWDRITDNYISYVMDNFAIDTIVAAFVLAVRTHQVEFNAETDQFQELFELISPWIVDGGKGVYVGDGKWDKEWKPPAKDKVDGIGGHFTLRDHHKNQ